MDRFINKLYKRQPFFHALCLPLQYKGYEKRELLIKIKGSIIHINDILTTNLLYYE